ncbi:ATP-binding protein [Thiolinea disciformis]|uniref:ATP-binding protein n=1 Tax=Thiolinea disciformis TaxID=125614 RepID=UPI00036471B0|nr:ATP-binding protein [Thiolinea disciformis]
MTKNLSLRNRLLILVLGAVSLVWAAAAIFTYYDARHELNEILDAHLAQSATLLAAQFAEELDDIDTEHVPLLHKYSRRVAFQVWEEGKLRLHSENAPSEPLATKQEGFSDSTIRGQNWRVFSTHLQHEDEELALYVAELREVRNELARHVARNLIVPLLIALPILGLLLWFAVRASLRPLVSLTQAVAKRQPENLTDLTIDAPKEVTPLVERLNHLFQRTRNLIANERRFTADAAHELRTPIAGIKAQVQVAQAADNLAERQRAMQQALQGCHHATHLIEQLLTLARLESTANVAWQTVDLHALAAKVIAERAPEAWQQQVWLELHAECACAVQGLPALLEVLLNNLIDNAIRHTPPQTRVKIKVVCTGEEACLEVCDNGTGVAADELEKITQRFYRPADSLTKGTGLGLSIVQRIADIHHAQLKLEPADQHQGLCVSVVFSL